jgi:hypothetical protein
MKGFYLRQKFESFCVRVFNLSLEADLHPRPSMHTLNRDREKSSGQAPSSIFEQYEPWTEPQLNLKRI